MRRTSVFWFAALFGLALVGFWPTYLAPRFERDWHVHLHGAAMFGWMVLLVAQAGLVLAGLREAHRSLGRVSYALAPLVVVSTALLAHYRLRQGITAELLYFLYVQASLIAAFALSHGLGLANRHRPAVHGRFMVCAALTTIDPIVARILIVRADLAWPGVQVMTYGLVDVILLALVLRDVRRGVPVRVYAGMLPVFVLLQLPTFWVSGSAAWRAFAEAFVRLPLP